MQKLNFKKEERLCSEKHLAKLYSSGSSFLFYPFRVTWLKNQELQPYPVSVVISVPKKRYKLSMHRNLLKRRIKEAYRLNKELSLYPFLKEKNLNLVLGINYVGKEILDFHYLHQKMEGMFKMLEKQIGSQ